MSRKGREWKSGQSARLRFSIPALLRAGCVNGHRSRSYLTPRSRSRSLPPPKVIFSPTRSFGSSLRWLFCPPRRIGLASHSTFWSARLCALPPVLLRGPRTRESFPYVTEFVLCSEPGGTFPRLSRLGSETGCRLSHALTV